MFFSVLTPSKNPRFSFLFSSEAKKMPAMGALKPAATPAAAPLASRASGFWLILAKPETNQWVVGQKEENPWGFIVVL